ncbi:type IV secretory system conjugative DNA transfer family protein [Streptomyces griseiscabiei]|uniref:ATP/GTP-binding protein n=1 Tax=Streptomyces griseiscabiei TaxID=2993540 RepID=A0ABU4LL28_9ACTN|nr:ATP/GTP-binding protein [Streptomyces griseiscabiei]MDX2916338.1 ATP/GTP-binding protein [Streptomyces griseiscabiei]
MDSAASYLTSQDSEGTYGQVLGLITGLVETVGWLYDHWYVLVLAVAIAWAVGEWVVGHLAERAHAQRMALELTPSRHFDPGFEEIFRRGVQLSRASTSMPWWAPRRSKTVQIRLRADGTAPIRYRVEGPAGGERLLSITPFGPNVAVDRAGPVVDKPRDHVVRAEFILRGKLTSPLRDVPLEPDPLQPLVDAVSDLRTELGDLAEIRLDIQRAPKWALRARRLQLMSAARRKEYRETQRTSRWVRQDATGIEDSLAWNLQSLITGKDGSAGRRIVMPPVPRRVDPAEALGKLADDDHLVRVQLLVMCASDIEGRAEARLAQLQAGFDVFGGRSRWAMRGWRLGPWRLGADHWPTRRSWERRWQLGQCQPPRANWVRLEELTGLLKPPTVHCRLPLLAGDLPSFEFGNPDLLLQGIHRGPDGRKRLVATYTAETLFECGVGKAGSGKTERALAQAIGRAHAGGGLMFIDPHRDSWPRAATFLAHDHLMQRIALIDLNAAGPSPMLSSWNPIAMHHGQAPHDVVEAVTDAFAAILGWDDAAAPRALTILTSCLAVLVAVNKAACQAGRRESQASIFHVRALISDPGFRGAALAAVADLLDEETRAWWRTVFPTFPPDAFGVVLNPLARLAANPVTRAFLGQPIGVYNSRAAMDNGLIVWVCPAGNGPTDRLLTALIARDLLRAVRSRRDTPEEQRRPFRLYFDELITLTGAAPETIASMFEDFRKFRVTVHGMTQLLGRLPAPVRMSLTQNASTLASTAGSKSAIAPITAEWGDTPSPDEVAVLDRFEHYVSFTIGGRRVGPVRITGPHLDEVFAEYARPRKVGALERAARDTAGAAPLAELTATAAAQQGQVADFLAQRAPATTADVRLNRNPEGYQ